jgi:hypothetical protein
MATILITFEELSSRSGIDIDTLRNLSALGLLPVPAEHIPGTLYGVGFDLEYVAEWEANSYSLYVDRESQQWELTPQGVIGFAERERIKAATREFYDPELQGWSYSHFKIISLMWWHRVRPASVSLFDYRRHLVRALQESGAKLDPAILWDWEPAKGKVKIHPGCSDYYPGGVPKPKKAR